MSKFGEALKKIQSNREPAKPEEKKNPLSQASALSDGFTAADEPARDVSFDAGIKRDKIGKPDLNVVMHHFPQSLVSEQYRMLRTGLKTQVIEKGAQVIMISSSLQGEGKSVTSANLSLALAEDKDVRVVVIDADIRRGKLHSYFGLKDNTVGLTDVLANNLDPRKALVKNTRGNLFVLPRGGIVESPSELIASQKFRILIAELRNHFDYVIIDSPPIMSVADPAIIAKESDGVLFVIRVGQTPKTMIAQSSILFKQAGARVLGYVLTDVKFQSADYRYYDNYKHDYHYTDRASGKGSKPAKLKKAKFNLENSEKKFTDWWHEKVLKN